LLTPIARAALGVELLEGSPGLQAFARDRPMQQIEIDVVETQPRQARVERSASRIESLVGIPQFGRDEYLVTPESTRSDRFADLVLISIGLRGVDVAVAEAQSGGDRIVSALAASRLPDAKSDLRNSGAVPERQ
jgi:hypothetical protein